ncbi:hypothetical protein K504DRAFT_462595 [Pleomassaria siparia CBS 279.74]|uniref:Uncharacterized protein n=1 Tax=Pleomassaria siparia CBS 279.74 TaxID=1314801 RepID=A0A6G1KMP5_9PLEO|nr:hypothetical protein K504DRAFT_462595 [Pleomassaria siparia CBS 279.74]
MTAHENTIQPAEDFNELEMDMGEESPYDENEHDNETQRPIPMRKSYIGVDPSAPPQTAKFQKDWTVHMSIIANGIQRKGTFYIGKSQYQSSGAFWQYQLVDPLTLKPYANGAWIRESKLKLQKKT